MLRKYFEPTKIVVADFLNFHLFSTYGLPLQVALDNGSLMPPMSTSCSHTCVMFAIVVNGVKISLLICNMSMKLIEDARTALNSVQDLLSTSVTTLVFPGKCHRSIVKSAT